MESLIASTLLLLDKVETEKKLEYIQIYEQYLVNKSYAQELFILSLKLDFVDAAVYLYQQEDVTLPVSYLTEDGKRSAAIDELRGLPVGKVIDSRLYPSNEGWKYFNYMVRYSKYEWKKKCYRYNKKYKNIDVIQRFHSVY